jgi:hypothetical protein
MCEKLLFWHLNLFLDSSWPAKMTTSILFHAREGSKSEMIESTVWLAVAGENMLL